MAKRTKRKTGHGDTMEHVHVATKRGMYLEVVLKDNKDGGEVMCAVNGPPDVKVVEQSIARMVRRYLRSFPLVPPQGFYSLLVMPRWVSLGQEQPGLKLPPRGLPGSVQNVERVRAAAAAVQRSVKVRHGRE